MSKFLLLQLFQFVGRSVGRYEHIITKYIYTHSGRDHLEPARYSVRAIQTHNATIISHEYEHAQTTAKYDTSKSNVIIGLKQRRTKNQIWIERKEREENEFIIKNEIPDCRRKSSSVVDDRIW